MKVRLPQNRKNVLQQPLCSEEDEEVTFMLDESAVGLSVEQDFSYTWRDLILYNLSVGAKQEELEYVYEKGLKAVPTFGVIPCTATFGTKPYSEQPMMPTKKIEGLRSDGTLHMDHKLVIHKPIPKEGKLHLEKLISLNTTVAFCNEQIDIFVATDLVKTQQHLDDGEYVEVFEYGIEELVDMVYQGKIMDAKTISGIMTYYEKYVRGRKVK